ncbi:DMT family transporter [Gayadomonas joobiniege]|uniref:DMT family transporter n=1 Tax=Gayadomonas joobiniege TaxID=1234606 RepID=UPI00038079EC|nr:DMT family transporter [Gayadomonas joobiniege]
MSASSNAPAQRKLALAQVHLGVLLLGGTALFSKIIPLTGATISFARAVVAALFLLLVVKTFEGSIRLHNARDYRNGILLGVMMAIHWVTYFYAMQLSTVATGMIALYTYPVMIVIFEPLFHKSLPRKMDLIMAMFVLFGVALMVPELSFGSDFTLGIALGVLSAVFFAARNILNHKVFSHYTGTRNMMFQSIIIALVLLPFEINNLADTSVQTWLWIVLLGIVFTALPHALLVNGLRSIKAKTMSLVSCLSPCYGAIFAAVLLSEYPNWQTLVGGAIVVSAAIYETVAVHRS